MNQIFFMCLVNTTTHIMTDSNPACEMTLLEFEHRLHLKVFDTLFNTDYTHIPNFKQKNKNCNISKVFYTCTNINRLNPLHTIMLHCPNIDTIQKQTTIYANYLNSYQPNTELRDNIMYVFRYLDSTEDGKMPINKLCPIPPHLPKQKQFKPVFDYITN